MQNTDVNDACFSYDDIIKFYTIYKKNEVLANNDKKLLDYLNQNSFVKNNTEWSDLEKETLITGIQIYGFSEWKEIRERFKVVFEINNRTWVDLKKKWDEIKSHAICE